MKAVRNIFLIALLAPSVGCLKRTPPPVAEPEVVVMGREAAPPVGVVRYCWDEPKAIIERKNPGLDEQGHWYHPDHKEVHEVKMGRWIPCR